MLAIFIMAKLSKEELREIAKYVREMQREDEAKKEEVRVKRANDKKKEEELKKLEQEKESYWKYYNIKEHLCAVINEDEYELEDHLKFNKDLTSIMRGFVSGTLESFLESINRHR